NKESTMQSESHGVLVTPGRARVRTASGHAACLRVALLAVGLGAAACSAAQTPAIDLCAGMVTDKEAHPKTTVARPAKGVAFTDPVFGSRVMRITDARADFGATIAKPLYATIPAWNIDESRLLLWVRDKGHALFDGRTYQFLGMLKVQPSDIEQLYWDARDPDVLWYNYSWEMSGRSLRQLTRYQVSSGQKSVVYDYPNAGKPRGFKVDNGGDPQFPSWDMKLWGVRVEMSKGSEKFSFAMPEKREGRRAFDDGPTPQACPSGRCMWVPEKQGSRLVDLRTLETVQKLKLWGYEHGNLGRNAAGEDFFAAVQFDSKPAGTLIVENLQTGVVKPVISTANGYPYPPTSTHISAVALRAPGWVAVSAVGKVEGRQALHQEVMLANVDSGTVCRVAHHRSHGKDGKFGYWAEPHVTISPSGTRVVFASDWDNGDAVDTYVVELPAYRRMNR
ncbi:MAG: hypothetical protein ABL900_12490, partial [Burkholderiaceae bacterium]